MQIVIDRQSTTKSTPFVHFWESTGFSPAKLMLRSDMELQMDLLGAIACGGMKYVRPHYLLDLVQVMRTQAGEVIGFDWQYLDEALRRMVRNGLKPIFELMGNPSGEFTRFSTREDLLAWRDFMAALITHLEDEQVFGKTEVRSWLFETWNEPDIPNGWFSGGADEFCAYYDACAAGVWSVDEHITLGGPGSCRTLSDLFTTFVAHCAEGKNYLSGKIGTRIDFLSVHEKGARNHKEDLTPNTLRVIERERLAMEYVLDHHQQLAGLPFNNDECDPQVGWWDTHTWRGKHYYAALAAKIILQHQQQFLEQQPGGRVMPYGLLSNDNGFLGRWGQRTMLARFTELQDEDKAQTEYQNASSRFALALQQAPCEFVKQPIFNLFSLLGLLGDEWLPVETKDKPEFIHCLATRKEGQLALLVVASTDTVNQSGEEWVELQVEHRAGKSARLTHYCLDGQHSNPFRLWEKLGAPEAQDASLTVEKLRQICAEQEISLASVKDISEQDALIPYSFQAQLPSVHVVVISEELPQPPSAPKKVWSKVYPGLQGRSNRMLRWQAQEYASEQHFEVLVSDNSQGPFTVIDHGNGVLLDSGFLHLDVGSSAMFYRIRVLDVWGRYNDSTVYRAED